MSVRIITGDCLIELPKLVAAGERFHACVTDPPYELKFMGKTWDGTGVAFRPETWRAVYDCLLPGAHLLAFGGTRGWHRLACAIEDAGFEIRDTICWIFGSGFPKNHSVNKALRGIVCDCEDRQTPISEGDSIHPVRDLREVDTSRPITTETQQSSVLQQLLPEQELRGAIASDVSQRTCGGNPGGSIGGRDARGEESSMEGWGDISEAPRKLRERKVCSLPGAAQGDGPQGRVCDGASTGDGAMDRPRADPERVRASQRSQASEQCEAQLRTLAVQSQSQASGAWPLCDRCGKPRIPNGLGTALKPAHEPIIVARKPLDGTVAANVLRHGCGALNVDACRVSTVPGDYASGGTHDHGGTGWGMGRVRTEEHSLGRWPANVIHDGSEEVLAAFPDAPGQLAFVGQKNGRRDSVNCYGDYGARPDTNPRGDSGSAARFFKACPYSEDEWNAYTNARNAAQSFDLQSELAAFALSDAVAQSMQPLALIRQSYQGRSTSVTASELRMVCATVTALILNIAARSSQEWPQGRLTLDNSPVICVARKGPTDTTMITASLWKSDGCAELATFSITETREDRGVRDWPHRFHYTAKADSADRQGSKHPTVKPTDLMRYLVQLVTPPGGTVLDPFAGTGSTGLAADQLGFNAVLIEQDATYAEDARRKVASDAPLLTEMAP